jgi:outer membrane biosynthesis protein TonB
MELAEASTEETGWGTYALRAMLVLLVAGLVAAGAWALKHMSSDSGGPKRQVARISILPDTPPPPPPPPREDKPPPPREEPKPMPQAEQPKPAEAEKAAEAPIKMEGAAGDGPSAFAAGAVRNDYVGGKPSTGAASAASTLDRAQERLYANTARQMLRDAIERSLKSDSQQTTAEFTVWLERDGAIRRVELASTGNPKLDGELNAALDDTQRTLRLPPPPVALQPMRFRLTVRPQG